MEIFKGQNIIKFAEQFKTDQDCREYLSKINEPMFFSYLFNNKTISMA